MIKKLLIGRCLLGAGLLLIVQPVFAKTASILFIAAGDSALQHQFLQDQQLHFPPSVTLTRDITWRGIALTGFIGSVATDVAGDGRDMHRLRWRVGSENYTFPDLCRWVDVVVAIGRDAAQAAIEGCWTPTLVILVTRAELESLLAATERNNISAIYLEADPVLNLRLIRLMMSEAVRVGVLVSPQSQNGLPRLRSEAHRLSLRLEEIKVTDDEDAVQELRHRIDGLDALLLLPETRIVNNWSLKPILLMSARSTVPTFGGIIENYVRAGVMAAIVADLDELHQQAAVFIAHLVRGDALHLAYPTAIRVAINDVVANAMAISTDDRDQLIPQIQDPAGHQYGLQ